jgi:hypothetical protein
LTNALLLTAAEAHCIEGLDSWSNAFQVLSSMHVALVELDAHGIG